MQNTKRIMSIGIIGGGNMGSALAKAFLEKSIVAKSDLLIGNEPGKNGSLLKQDILIIAVKPQQFDQLAQEISGKIAKKTIVISIMAGVPIDTIQKKLGHDKIVRAMPNTPALVNQGVVGWFGQMSAAEKKTVQNILSAAGFAFEVKEESQIDDVTALSGCGPGFFFTVFNDWLEAARTLNLPEQLHRTILTKTLQGSLALLENSSESPLELANRVASKGGSTEQGILVLQAANLKNLFSKTLKAAYNRCKEMSKN